MPRTLGLHRSHCSNTDFHHGKTEGPKNSITREMEKNADKRMQGLSAARDAVRMARIAKFYERLPKGPAPEIKPSGLLGRYQAKYFGKEPSAARE